MFEKIVNDIHELIDRYVEISTTMKYNNSVYPAVPMKHLGNFLAPIGASKSDVLEYATEHKMPEIMGKYKTISGLKYGDMQDYVRLLDDANARGNVSKQGYIQRVGDLYDALVDLNPELKQVDVSGGDSIFKGRRKSTAISKKFAVIVGVDDGFNIGDLKYYNDTVLGMRSSFNNANGSSSEYDNLKKNVMKTCGAIYWRASPETLIYIQGKEAGLSPNIDVMQPSSKPVSKPRQHGF